MALGADPERSASEAFWERYLAAQPINRTRRVAPVLPRDGALPYLPGLDGIRALAVAAVLLYHLEVGWLRGGFLGVEVFFVLSGYLITSLLLAEWRRARAIDLKAFWLRRARRLLPALYLLLIGTLAYAIAFLPDELARLRRDALAAFAYVTNWYLIFGHTSYFEAIGRPSLLQHLWSLAVEEQFYLLWPPLFFALMRRGRRWALAACLAGALASTALMAALFDPGVDPSRLYYGTDTRAAELLLGAALAFVWDPVRLGDPARARGRLRRWLAAAPRAALVLDGAAAVALLALVGLFHALGEIEPRLYRGGFAVVALVTLVLIAATAHPRARWAPRLIGSRPLRWVGQRSYGIYLWHWPVFMVTRPGLDVPLAGLPLLALRLAVTVGLAEASYRWVETPFRRGAVGRAWRAWREAEGPRRRWVALGWGSAGTLGVMLSLTLGVIVSRAQAPGAPAYLPVSEIHTVAMGASPTPATPAATPGTPPPSPIPVVVTPAATPTPSPSPRATATPRPSPSPTPKPTATPTPTSAPVPATRVSAVGDSVMLSAASQLQQDIGPLGIDAAIGMQVSDAIDVIRQRQAEGALGDVVVIHVGDNGYFTDRQFDEIMALLARARRVIFVNVKVPRQWEGANNQVIARGVARYRNAVLVDWHGASAGHPEYFWSDGIHLRPEGARVYAQLIAAQIARR